VVFIIKKYLPVAVVLLLCILCLGGCKKININDDKIRDLDFTVVPQRDIPAELKEIIEDSKENVIRKTFTDKENLYIVVGYGEQPTSGYSIAVKELYEGKSVIYVKTWLIGPSKTDKVVEQITYPYIVIKIEYDDKRVVFK